MSKFLITQAKTLAEYDPPIFMLPVRLRLNDGKLDKVPTLSWKEPVPFRELLRSLKGTNALGIDLGKSGLVTLDVDSYKDECNFDAFIEEHDLEIPYTWKIKSGSGGTHYIFANPNDLRFRGKIPGVEAVDIKAHGGYSVAPPSKLKDRVYEWIVGPDELEEGPAMVPQWLFEWAGKDGTAGDMGENLRLKAAARDFQENKEVLDQLAAAPNNLDDREEWLKIAFGLFFEFQDTPEEGRARDVFLSWSAKWDDSEKAVENAVTTWDSLPRIAELTTDNPATIASVVRYLQENPTPKTEEEIAEIKETVAELTKKKVDRTDFLYDFSRIATIPPRQWVHGTDALKGEVTMVAAPGGVGKSSTVLVMSLAMATGKSLLGRETYGTRKVMLWSGEDGRTEIDRRIMAAMKHYKLTPKDIGDRLHVVTHDDLPLNMVREVKDQQGDRRTEINSTDVDYLIEYMREHKIEVASFDPLVSVHQTDENSNTDATIVTEAFKKVASQADAAIVLVHHVSKGALRDDSKGDAADAARGATAWVNASRVTLALRQMSAAEASAYRVTNVYDYAEIVEAKANASARHLGGKRYIEKVSVNIGNGDAIYIAGDDVGVVVPWSPNGDMQLALAEKLISIMHIVNAQHELYDDTGAGYIFRNEQNAHWAGYGVAQALGLPIGEESSQTKRSNEENHNRTLIRAYFSKLIEESYMIWEDRNKPSDRHPAPAYVVLNDGLFDLKAQIGELKKQPKKGAAPSGTQTPKCGTKPTSGAA